MPWASHLVDDREHVGGRDHDDVGLEVEDQLHLALRHPARHRHDRAAQALGAGVGAEAPGEQAVAIRVVEDHPAATARRTDGAGDHVGPHVEVVAGVADDRRLAGRAARRVEPYDVLARHREHAERVVLAQRGLRGERQPGEVGEGLDLVGVHARVVERLPVVGDVVVGVAHRPPQPLELEGTELLEGCGLDRVQVAGPGSQVMHVSSSGSRRQQGGRPWEGVCHGTEVGRIRAARSARSRPARRGAGGRSSSSTGRATTPRASATWPASSG